MDPEEIVRSCDRDREISCVPLIRRVAF